MSATASALALAALGLITAAPAHAAATTLYVAQNGGNDAGNCTQTQPCATIGAAVTKANPEDTVSIASGTYDEDVAIHKSLTLAGSPSGTAIIHSTQTGGDAVAIAPDASTQGSLEVTLKDLTVNSGDPQYYVTGIYVSDATVHLDGVDSSQNGIGMLVYSGKTDVTDSEFSNNIDGVRIGSNDDGPVQDVTLTSSTVASNLNTGVEAIGDGATVTVVDSVVRDTGSGVGIRGSGTLTVQGSTVTGNGRGGIAVDQGTGTITDVTVAGNHGRGIETQQSTLTMTRTTVSGTLPFDPSMGVPYKGGMGVLAQVHATVSIRESTIYGNTGHGIVDLGSAVTVANSTIAATLPSQDDPGTIYLPKPGAVAVASGPGGTASVVLSATIATGTSEVPACAGPVTDAGYNLDTDGTCAFSTPSVSKADPQLGTLADNSGPTQTVLPAKAKTNPALDAIPLGKAGCATDAKDQRGFARAQGAGCDIGAVELTLPPITISPDALPDGKVGEKYSATLTASGGLGEPYAWAMAPGSHLPDGLSLSKDGVISGTPRKAGTFHVTVSVDDPVLRDYTLTIAPGAAATSPPASSPPASAPPTSAPASGTTSPPAGSPPSTAASGSGSNLAETGAHTSALLGIAAGLLGLGLLGLGGAGWSRRRHG